MRIDFVSDIACPWCAVGLASLDEALRRLGPEIGPVEVRPQPFELNPTMAPEGEDAGAHLRRKYGIDDAQVERSRQALRERGAAVGFAFGRRERIHNTFDAHRLIAWAGSLGDPARQLALKRALLQAYHGDGRDPSDHAVLVEAAASVGLDAAQAAAVLAGDAHAQEVRDEEARWRRAGIDSVPSIVVDGRHLIQGGQPPEVFERALRRLAREAPPADAG